MRLLWLVALCGLLTLSFGLTEEEVGRIDWHRTQYGAVKFAHFSTSRKKHVYVGTEVGVVAGLSMKSGKQIWRNVLPESTVDAMVQHENYLLTLSSDHKNETWRLWNAADGTFAWDLSTYSRPSESASATTTAARKSSAGDAIFVQASTFATDLYLMSGNMVRKVSFGRFPQGGTSAVWTWAPEEVELRSIVWESDELQAHGQDSSGKKVSYLLSSETGAATESAAASPSEAPPSGSGDAVCGSEAYVAAASISASSLSVTLSEGTDTLDSDKAIAVGEPRGSVRRCFLNVYDAQSGAPKYRLLAVGADDSVMFVTNGKLSWLKEEALASIATAHYFELPANSLFSQEETQGYPSFFGRLGPQIEYAKSLLSFNFEAKQAAERFEDDREREDPSSLRMDTFGFRKLLVVTTKVGKVFALNTETGNIVWTHLVSAPKGSALSALRLRKLGHHNALVLSDSTRQSDGQVTSSAHYFDAVSGRFQPDHALPFAVSSVFTMPFLDENRAPVFLLVGEQLESALLPDSAETRALLTSNLGKVFFHIVDKAAGTMNGYSLVAAAKGEFKPVNVWTVAFPEPQEKITAVSAANPSEPLHSAVRRTGSGEQFMKKYYNPNLLVVATTRGNPPPGARTVRSVKRSTDPSVNVYLVDTVTGAIVDKYTHIHAQGPVHVVQSENFVVYHYFNSQSFRYELSVLELFEDDKTAANSNVDTFSSFTAAPPQVLQQTYVFTTGVQAIGVSSSSKGITPKQIMVGLVSDQLLGIQKRLLDPRRPMDDPTMEDKMEGLVPYSREILAHPQMMLSYNLTVARVSTIISSSCLLESTSLVFAYGLDLFSTRSAPAETFDRLSPTFNKPMLVLTVSVVIGLTLLSRHFANKKRLDLAWSS